MGQAKLRGTFEERSMKAKEKRLKDGIDAIRRAREREAALTPEQRAKRHKARTMLAWMMGMSTNVELTSPPISTGNKEK